LTDVLALLHGALREPMAVTDELSALFNERGRLVAASST
jgi:hypothetical protein